MERGRHAIDTRKLIELVRANPMLYDPTLDEHKDISSSSSNDEGRALGADSLGDGPTPGRSEEEMEEHQGHLHPLPESGEDEARRQTKQPQQVGLVQAHAILPSLFRAAAAAADAADFDDTAALEPYFVDPLQNLKMEVGDVVLEEQTSSYPDADQESSEYEAGVHFTTRRKSPLRLPYGGAGLETNMDETELLFVAFAKTVKKFSKRRLAKAKMLVAKVVMEQELINIEEQNALDQSRDPACPPSSSDSISADQRASVNRQAVKN